MAKRREPSGLCRSRRAHNYGNGTGSIPKLAEGESAKCKDCRVIRKVIHGKPVMIQLPRVSR